jgi:excisionase family DNA binding protein
MTEAVAILAYTFPQAVTASGLSRTTLERYIASNQLIAHKHGRRVLISRASLESLLKRDHAIPSNAEMKKLRAEKRAQRKNAPSPRSGTKRLRGGAR